MRRITEADIETMVEVEQMQIREAIAEYHKWRKTVDQLEGELSHAESELQDAIDRLKNTVDQLEGELSHAESELQDAIDRLDSMGVVEYE